MFLLSNTVLGIVFVFLFFMQVARHTRAEGHFKVWATIIFKRPLPPTPRAETGLPPFKVHTDEGLGIISPKPGR